MSILLDSIRFGPEARLIAQMYERYQLETLVNHHLEGDGMKGVVALIMSTHIRLNETLSPRLCSLFKEVTDQLGFEEDTEIFVKADANINAGAIYIPEEGKPHIMSMTSGLVERMNDEELRFVFGHEVGHLAYQHYLAGLAYEAAGKDAHGRSNLPLLVQNRLSSWQRLAEISADRAGFEAVDGNFEAIVSAFFKIDSGLGPEHLRFDISAFLNQLTELQAMKKADFMTRFTHPITPIRVRALQIFHEAGRLKTGVEGMKKVDEAVTELTMLMEREVTEPLEVKARDFLLAGGMLANAADGEVEDDQWNHLLQILLPLCADPEAEVERIKTIDQAKEMMQSTMIWLSENAGEERYYLFRQMATLVSIDGRLHENEKTLMEKVAVGLNIPSKVADEMLHDVLRKFIQATPSARTGFFNLQ